MNYRRAMIMLSLALWSMPVYETAALSVHVQDAPIRSVLEGLARSENLNLVLDDTVDVTIWFDETNTPKAAELSARFGLDAVLKRRAGKLSGGWQRRLSIAMALISEPQILFLDEPTLGLDVLARSDLWEVIRALKGKITIILTTHYMEEAEALSDEIGIQKDGRLLARGTAQALKVREGTERFEDAFVAIVKGAAK